MLGFVVAALAGEVVLGSVTASSGRSCGVALHVDAAKPVPVVLSLAGSGLYASTAEPPPAWYRQRVERGELAYLVFDKPGVQGVDAEGSVRFDADTFAIYTPQDLVDCAEASLAWAVARGRVHPDRQVIVGHSEGALVAAAVAEAALAAGDAERFATIVLSGFPVEGLEAAMAHQARRGARRALEDMRRREARDRIASLREGPGIGVVTVEAWWARGDAHGAVAALVGSGIPVLVQHGIEDQAVPLAWIRDLAAQWSSPSLVVQLFDAGHFGNLAMVASQSAWVDGLLGLDPATGFVGSSLPRAPTVIE